MGPAWHPNEDSGLSSQELYKSWKESDKLAKNYSLPVGSWPRDPGETDDKPLTMYTRIKVLYWQ